MKIHSLVFAATLIGALPNVSVAQVDSARPPAPPQASPAPTVGPPVRRIATASALSKEKIGAVTSVRELPDGRVLLNDGTSRRLLLLDTLLQVERVVLDSMSEKENTYGNRQGALLPYRADSSIFIDQVSLALLVIDPAGNITRVRSVPRANESYAFASGQGSQGIPGTDARGRLVYRKYAEAAPPLKAPPRGVPYFPEEADSAFIVALDFDTRKLDTLGAFKIPVMQMVIRLAPNGACCTVYPKINPMPVTDEWTLLSDGTLAFVRGIDYRIDYRSPDGTWTSSPKIPYDWQPMPDSAKEKLLDSVRTAQNKAARTTYVSAMIRWVNTYKRKYPANFVAPEGYVPPNGFSKTWIYPPGVTFPEKYTYACAPGEEPVITAGADGSRAVPDPRMQEMMAMAASMGITIPNMPTSGNASCIPLPIPNLAQIPNPPTTREVVVVDPKVLPDFKPPFQAASVRSDMDGNMWVRSNSAKPLAPGVNIFDVISREGQLVDRIQLPPGYSLVGFGRGRVVFLSMRDREGQHLARIRLTPRP
jgi:hypothetical protein